MWERVLETLKTTNRKIILDCTFGSGGHTELILKKLQPSSLIAIDLSKRSFSIATELSVKYPNLIFRRDNFKNLKKILHSLKIPAVNGVLVDLGWSTDQLSEKTGLSFKNEKTTLDMRYSELSGNLTALKLLNTYEKSELKRVFRTSGFRHPEALINSIFQNRPFSSSREAIEMIDSLTKNNNSSNFQNKQLRLFFQALRIEVNDEVNNLKRILQFLPDILEKEGKAIIITFHSLEEDIIKEWMRTSPHFGIKLSNFGVNIPPSLSFMGITKPDTQEIGLNRSSRSAKLWTFVRV